MGTRGEDPAANNDLVKGIPRPPLQSTSNTLSHLGTDIWNYYVMLDGTCMISWSMNCPQIVKANVAFSLFICATGRTGPTALLIYLALGKPSAGLEILSA